jgi:hypothetical protein
LSFDPAKLRDEFLAAPVLDGIEYIARADVRRVIERFLAACAELSLAPAGLRAADMRQILQDRLPGRYAPGEKLGQRTIDVLRTYLAFLEPQLGPERARELCVALEQSAEPFRARVRGKATA